MISPQTGDPAPADVTIIIPVYNLVGPRLRNFNVVIARIARLCCKVLVVEQVGRVGRQKSAIAAWGIQVERLSSAVGWHKSVVMNHAANACDTEWLWFLDADVVCDFRRVLQKVAYSSAEIIQPFDRVILLDNAETEAFSSGEKLNFKAHERRARPVRPGPFTFLVRTRFFKSVGGMDEQFVGYGYEDLEFLRRSTRVGRLEVFRDMGIHLWHKRLSPTPENRALWLAQPGHVGLGDSVAGLCHLLRLDRLSAWYSKRRGKPCGCAGRRKWLNRMVPYRLQGVRNALARVLPAP